MLKFAKGNKTGSSPTRTPDSLNSTDTVEVLLGISEGPIKGLVDGPKSFRADDTPLLNSSGEPNFQNFGLDVWPGNELGHTIKLDLGGFSSPININVSLAQNTPVVRSGFIKGIDAADFRVVVQQLLEQTDKGTFKNDLSIRFEVKRKTDPTWSPAWIASPGNILPGTGTGTGSGSGGGGGTGGGGGGTDVVQVLQFANDDPIDNGDYLSWRSFGTSNNLISFAGDTQTTVLGSTTPTSPPVDPTISSIGVHRNGATGAMTVFSWVPSSQTWVPSGLGGRTLFPPAEVSPETPKVADLWYMHTEVRVFNGVAWVKGMENSAADPVLNQSGVWSINEKTTSATAKDIRVFLPNPGVNDEWEFRVTKLSADSGTEKFSEVTWESVQEISRKPMLLKGVALARVIGRASDQFTSLPTWNGDWLGRIVKIPSNYNPTTRIYTGVWDGTYKIDWTDNAAYIFQDFVENDRYGLSSVYPHVVNKWKIYEWGRHNDVKVLRPSGELRPRWTYNDYIQQARDAKELAQYIAGSAGARYVDDGNGIVEVIIDKDDPAVAIFTKENIGEDGFSYSYTDRLTRANEITVEFVNPNLNWNNDKRIVRDDADIAVYGRIPENFIAVGCIDVDEAEARARRRLIGGLTEKEINTFTTNRKGKFLAEWNVILCGDADMGRGLTGRIRAVTGARSVTLRDPLSFEPGIEYWATFDIVNPDYPENSSDPFRIERRRITNNAGIGQASLTFASDLPDLPEYAAFVLEAPDILGFPKPYRITNIQDDSGTGDMIRITCLELNRNKWDFIDTGEEQDPLVYTNFASGKVLPPVNPTIEPFIRPKGAASTRVLRLTWQKSPSQWVRRYKVYHSIDGTPLNAFEPQGLEVEIEGAEVGYHTFAIVAIDIRGRESEPLSISYNVVGEARPTNRPRELELVNGTTSTRFDTIDATFGWKPPELSPTFSHYKVVVKHAFTSTNQVGTTIETQSIVRTVDNIVDTTWTYGFAEQKADQDSGEDENTARRDFIVQVVAVDQFGAESNPASIAVFNGPPNPVAVTVVASPLALYFQFPRPAEIDYAGIAIWISEEPGVDVEGEPVWKNAGNPVVAADPEKTYYYRYAFYDEFGMNGVVISNEQSVETPAAQFEIELPDLDGIRDDIDDLIAGGEQVRHDLETIALDLLGRAQDFSRLTGEQERLWGDIARLSRTQMRDILINVDQARTRDRLTHLVGRPIGPIVETTVERTDTLVRFTDLLGVVTPNGGGIVLNESLVQVRNGVTLAQQISLLESGTGEAYSRIYNLNQALSAETYARTLQVNEAVSVFNQNISIARHDAETYADAVRTYANQTFSTTSAMLGAVSAAEIRQQTYSDGVRTYANQTFATTSAMGSAISAAEIRQQTYADGVRTYANSTFSTISAMNGAVSAAEIRQQTYTDALRTYASQTFATTSAMGTAIAQAEARQQTYSDGVTAYANQTFRTAAQVGAAISASEITQRSYVDNLVATSGLAFVTNSAFGPYASQVRFELDTFSSASQSYATRLGLLGSTNGNNTAFILDLDKTYVSPTESLATRQNLVESRFNGGAPSYILTRAEVGATAGGNAITTLTQMGVPINNGGAFQMTSSQIRVSGAELLSQRLETIEVRNGGEAARVDQRIQTSIGPGGVVASWAAGVYTTRGALEAVAGLNFESLGGIAARASLFVQANGTVGGVFVGINQGLVDLKFQFDKLTLTDVNGGNPTNILTYVPGTGWTFNSNVTVNGNLILNGTLITDKLQDNSVTQIVNVSMGGELIGNGAAQLAIDFYMNVPRNAQMIFHAGGRHSYSSNIQPWNFYVLINGVLPGDGAAGAGFGTDSIATNSGIYVGPGNHHIQVIWLGGDSTIKLVSANITAMAVYK